MKIKAYTNVNENTNTHYFKEFEVVNKKPEGEWTQIYIDTENDNKAFDYAYWVNKDGEAIAIKQNYPENEVEASVKAIATALQLNDDNAEEIYQNMIDHNDFETLTQNTARNGRPVIWYLDSESNEAAIYLDTNEVLDEAERQEQLY